MITLDPTDGSQQRPVDMAARVSRIDQRGRTAIARKGPDRDARTVQGDRR
jgi:hypothetical protein